LYNSANEVAKLLEIDVERYFTDPGDEPIQPQPDPKAQELQMNAQIEQQKMQAHSQLEQQKMQSQAQLEQQKLQLQAQIEQVQAQADIATQNKKIEAEMALAQQKFELERQLKILELEMRARDREMSMAHEDRIMGKKMRFEANKGRAQRGEDFNDNGEITPGPVLDTLAQKMDLIAQAQHETHKAVVAPRETTIVKDAKGKAIKSVSRVVT
jgi:HD-GYP domain-containing protein (c-di-GMP phosphodiesterase class II)